MEVLVEFDGTGKAIAGSWREKVPGGVCGKNKMLDTEVNVTPHGLKFQATLPGEARGDLELQADTLGMIARTMRGLGILDDESYHLEVVNTRDVGPARTVLENGSLSPWKESWEMRICGKDYVVPVAFVPDSTGTGIRISPSEIHPKQ